MIDGSCKNYGMESRQNLYTRYTDANPFVTKDGSTIRELMHPASHAVKRQSFAEAIVDIGSITEKHFHPVSEEIYHITAGVGMMHLGVETFRVAAGDTIVIHPGTPHNIENIGEVPLKILCACTPAYSDEDTVLV